MPGFLGGFAGGLANRLEKAGTDYTKEQKDKATEDRQAARIEALRQTKRSEDFFSQTPGENEEYLLELPDKDGNIIAQLPLSQMELAKRHNAAVKAGRESTTAENANRLAKANDEMGAIKYFNSLPLAKRLGAVNAEQYFKMLDENRAEGRDVRNDDRTAARAAKSPAAAGGGYDLPGLLRAIGGGTEPPAVK